MWKYINMSKRNIINRNKYFCVEVFYRVNYTPTDSEKIALFRLKLSEDLYEVIYDGCCTIMLFCFLFLVIL